MSKFCGNCGAKMDDTAMVCGYCGTPLSGATGENFVYVDPQKKEKNKKIIKSALITVVLVIALAIVASIASSFIGYRGAVRKFMNAYKTEDAGALVDMSCSFLKDIDYFELLEGIYQDELEEDFDGFDDYFSSRYSIKYEITNASKLSERQIRSLTEDALYEEDYRMLKAIMNVRVTITAKHGSDSTSTTKSIYLGKEANGWGLLFFE